MFDDKPDETETEAHATPPAADESTTPPDAEAEARDDDDPDVQAQHRSISDERLKDEVQPLVPESEPDLSETEAHTTGNDDS